jgi:LPXTG-site transpeptidase (sortase) family protein
VGHNYKNAHFFGNLKKLTIGDNILLESTNGNAQMYKVYDIYIVDETDMSCTSQETNGKIELTLITCDNDNTKRLVVKCRV